MAPAYVWVAMVVTDKQNYLSKAQDLLADRDTYKPISGDPTTRHENKLIQTFSNIKTWDG